MKSIVVVGGSSGIGASLLKSLSPNYQCINISRSAPASLPNVEHHALDVLEDALPKLDQLHGLVEPAHGHERAGEAVEHREQTDGVARDLGPRLFTWLAGWGDAVFLEPNSTWWLIPVAGPMLGGLLGAAVSMCFVARLHPRES